MTPAGGPRVESVDHLRPEQATDVLGLAARIEAADGAPPLNEDAILHLTSTAPGRHQLITGPDGRALGYAQVVVPADGPVTAEIAVGLTEREPVAAALFDAAESVAAGPDAAGPDGPDAATREVLVWAHGERSPVGPAARERGYREDRVLLSMARPVGPGEADEPPPALPPGSGVRIRTFVPGQDDAAWLRVNARAFAGHPEQGRWTAADLTERLAQPWFDPAGFFLAVEGPNSGAGHGGRADDARGGGAVLGFHWTKVHPPSTPGGRPVGEVYVIGIDPRAQGRGIGGVLLGAGLAHLAGAGAAEVILYTDESNRGAVALYRRSGFDVSRREVQFRRPAASTT